MSISGEFAYNSAQMDGHMSALTASVKKLQTNLQDLEAGDTKVAARWEGETKAAFAITQKQFRTAFDEFNLAFTKFITTTGTNGEAATATDRAGAGMM